MEKFERLDAAGGCIGGIEEAPPFILFTDRRLRILCWNPMSPQGGTFLNRSETTLADWLLAHSPLLYLPGKKLSKDII